MIFLSLALLSCTERETIIKPDDKDNIYPVNCAAGIAIIAPRNVNNQKSIIFNNPSQTGCDQFYYQINNPLDTKQ